jgi:glycosyltransferase involved in cell wall biosynthesis
LKINKTAIIHEWFVNYAGSERCVESLINLYPDADVFSLVDFLNEEEREIILKGKRTKTSFIQNLPFAKKRHRNYLPLFPYAIEHIDLSGYKLIISSSHAVAKGVKTNKGQLHICYCHTPIRYAWDLRDRYLTETGLDKGIKGWVVKKILNRIQRWDLITSTGPDYFIANSNHIAKRIKKYYDRESTVIHPPVDVDKFTLNTEKESYYLTASRMVPYKRMDLIVDVFNDMPDRKLVVIGHGPELNKIKAKAQKNIEIIGYQSKIKLNEYMHKARAFVFAAEEDFGIIVVEAMACGTPVIAWNYGGTAESVVDGKTGILFNNQTKESIISAIGEFENASDTFNPELIREHAQKFSRKNFEDNISKFINDKANKFFTLENQLTTNE